jgi:hypothetical protein
VIADLLDEEQEAVDAHFGGYRQQLPHGGVHRP